MTDLTPAATRTEGPAAVPSPPGRRLTRPRWRDSRLLIGVLLVLVSVVLGARLFATADRTRAWVVAKGDLPAGHVVVAGDLATTSAYLSLDAAKRYYPGERGPEIVGAMLSRPVSAGELVSGADFVRSNVIPTRLVSVVVKDGRAPSLAPGDHVDLFAYQRSNTVAPSAALQAGQSAQAAQSAVGSSGTEVLVLHDVEFISRETLTGGAHSLTLRVPVDLAINAVAASQSERVDLVKLERGARGDVGGAGPSAVPGYAQ
ncbi:MULTISPECIES: SAF domain-containing protein [unclassified Frankia]|uniref:SAF domain-containing protein n=1 Tax=unclassified Frankia TaxID=2632575 RepID=UPI002AD4B814|nr:MULTISPECIES: SAF domain-containing protein [unclassified Frankia]